MIINIKKKIVEKEYLILVSSNKNESLQHFFELFTKFKFLNLKVNLKQVKKRKSIVSVLKSPHVNKTAQEQFNRFKISRLLKIRSIDDGIFIVFLKYLKGGGYPDVRVHCTFNILTKPRNPKSLQNPDVVVYNSKGTVSSLKYLRLLDLYGGVRL